MKKLKITLLICSLIIFFILTNCNKDKTEIKSIQPVFNLSGYAQKGPFINGSSVTVFDLNADLSPTGKTYNSQITDNKGQFQVNNISLSSYFVNIRTDGFYFNEITGTQSASQITLNVLSDITNKSSLNINLLTSLEKQRVENLIKSGKSFSESKIQAQKEILAIFSIEKNDIKNFESLTISENGDDNGILLAISSILQGFRSESEMTELVSNISNDIKDDGILNNEVLGSALINHAVYLDTFSIKNNLIKHYNEIGLTASIPNFSKYISIFRANTKYVPTQSLITYPLTGINGDNILSLSKTNYIAGTSYSLTAQLAKSTNLKIKIRSLNDTTIIPATDSTAMKIIINNPIWYYSLGSNINWNISDFEYNDYTQTFIARHSNTTCDLNIFFEKGSFLIEYCEINTIIPNRKRIITCN